MAFKIGTTYFEIQIPERFQLQTIKPSIVRLSTNGDSAGSTRRNDGTSCGGETRHTRRRMKNLKSTIFRIIHHRGTDYTNIYDDSISSSSTTSTAGEGGGGGGDVLTMP